MIKRISDFLEKLLAQIDHRQKKILEKRYGLENGEKQTLQTIGVYFDITRERVRQIEEQGIKKIKSFLDAEKTIFPDCVLTVKDYLDAAGGLRRDDLFIQDLKHLLTISGEKWPEIFEWKLKFLLAFNDEIKFAEPNEDFYGFWHSNEEIRERALKIIREFYNLCEKAGRQKIIVQKTHLNRIKYLAEIDYLALSKKFGLNIFGDFGLNFWPEIRPRVVGDKAYLILKKYGEPLHFRDLTAEINRLNFDGKKAHPQTVHNELIGDERFVLVGRGIYGLAEQGYLPGTAREVLIRILRQRSPLSFSRIVQLTRKERFLRENTILLNLQNKHYFQRLPDNRYTLVN